jgi:DNA-binding MarR family transcriptional regulator
MSAAADEFCELYPAVYLRFCRRPGKQDPRLTPQMASVLTHLSRSGPLTVGEMALHFDRAQSVVSEIVDGMVRKGLLERIRDSRDRRRTLVWLTDAAHEAMRREREVLDRERVREAMKGIGEPRARALVEAMRELAGGGEETQINRTTPKHAKEKKKR